MCESNEKNTRTNPLNLEEAKGAIKDYIGRLGHNDATIYDMLYNLLYRSSNNGAPEWGDVSGYAYLMLSLLTAAASGDINLPAHIKDDAPEMIKSLYLFFSDLNQSLIAEAEFELFVLEEYWLDKDATAIRDHYTNKTEGCKKGTVAVVG